MSIKFDTENTVKNISKKDEMEARDPKAARVAVVALATIGILSAAVFAVASFFVFPPLILVFIVPGSIIVAGGILKTANMALKEFQPKVSGESAQAKTGDNNVEADVDLATACGAPNWQGPEQPKAIRDKYYNKSLEYRKKLMPLWGKAQQNKQNNTEEYRAFYNKLIILGGKLNQSAYLDANLIKEAEVLFNEVDTFLKVS